VTHNSFEPGQGVAGYVYEQEKTILVPDVDKFEHYLKTKDPYFIVKSMIGSPICLDNEIIGAICADMNQLDWFDEIDRETLEAIASQAAIAIKNYDLYNKAYQRQEMFISIGNTLNGEFFQNENDILKIIFNHARSLEMQYLSIALYDHKKETVHFVLTSFDDDKKGEEIEDKDGWQSRVRGTGKTEHIVQTGKSLLLDTNGLKEWRFSPRPGDQDFKFDEYPIAWLGVPMKVGEEVIGVIADYRYDKKFSKNHINIMEALAHYAAIAILNLRYRKVEIEKTKENLEKIWGINNLRQISWMEMGLKVTRSVCRIIVSTGDNRQLKYGTGFLIRPNLLMTNHHVISNIADAKKTIVEFDYQLDFHRKLKTTRYCLDTSLFRTDQVLDYTIVGVDVNSSDVELESWGYLDLNENADPLPGEYVNIIQHPNGGTKQIVLTANEVTKVDRKTIEYTTDTMPGSSGSPVFNDLWQVIAIHHAGGSNNQDFYWNQGILMSAIKSHAGNFWPH